MRLKKILVSRNLSSSNDLLSSFEPEKNKQPPQTILNFFLDFKFVSVDLYDLPPVSIHR